MGYNITPEQHKEFNNGKKYFRIFGEEIGIQLKLFKVSYRYVKLMDYIEYKSKGLSDAEILKKYSDKDNDFYFTETFYSEKEVRQYILEAKVKRIKADRLRALETLKKYDEMLAEYTEEFI